MHEIMNKIDLTVDKYNMLSYGDTVVIGVGRIICVVRIHIL